MQRHAAAVAKQHEVTTLTLHRDPSLQQPVEITEDVVQGVREFRAYFRGKGTREQFKAFRSAVHSLFPGQPPFDIIHHNVLFPAGWQAMWLNRKWKVPYIITEHWTGFHNGDFAKRSAWQRALARRVGRRAAVICPVSEHLGNAMGHSGIRNRFEVVGNVVDTALFHPADQAPEAPTLIHVSSLVDAHKNISGMLKALRILQDGSIPLQVHFVGDGDIRPHQAHARQLGIHPDRTRFDGEQPLSEIAHRMRRHGGLLLFSNYENMPCVIGEAFASGLSVVSSDVGGISEHVSPERGALVPPGDAAALARAMEDWVRNRHGFNREALRAYAVEHFAEAAIARRFSEVYSKVLEA